MKAFYLKVAGTLIASFFVTQFLGNTLFLNASPTINPQFLAQLPTNVGNFLASPLKNNSGETTNNVDVAHVPAGKFFGYNIHSLALLDDTSIQQALATVQKGGATTVRFWGFAGGDNIDKVLRNAPAGMNFIITLSNYYGDIPQLWPAPQTDPTDWYGSTWQTNGYKDFITQVTTKYKGNSKILIWELMNEPNCTADQACTDAQHTFMTAASAIIAQNDPGKLISPGTQAQNTGGEHFDNGDFDAIATIPNITAISCHMYGTTSFNSTDTDNCNKALQIANNHGRTFYIGEAGLNYGCTTAACTNACTSDQLNNRETALLAARDTFFNSGSTGFIIWQFSLLQNSTLTCDGSSVFPGDPLLPDTGATPTSAPSTQPTSQPGNPTVTPTVKPTTTPETSPTSKPNNTSGTVKIVVHTDSTTGAVWSETTGKVQVYLEGPSSNGHRFGETISIFGTNKTSCKSGGGFPYTCTSGTAEWKGADGTSGTATGDYSVRISNTPTGWSGVDGATNATGTLSAGQTLTLDLAVKKN